MADAETMTLGRLPGGSTRSASTTARVVSTRERRMRSLTASDHLADFRVRANMSTGMQRRRGPVSLACVHRKIRVRWC
eukprot:363309-Chlamydomonas_euryale.AAC.31